MYIDEKKSNFDLKFSFDCVNFILYWQKECHFWIPHPKKWPGANFQINLTQWSK